MKKLLLLLIFIFCISSVFAFEFDNVKSYDKDKAVITITNAFGLGSKLAEYKLIENKDSIVDASAGGTAVIYSADRLFSDLKFYNQLKGMESLNFKVYYNVTVPYTETIYTYKDVCNDVLDKNNSKTIKICNTVIDTKKDAVKYKETMKEYNGEILDAGIYKWEIQAKKPKINYAIEWIATAYGKELTDWAWWDGNWDYAQCFNVTNIMATNIVNGTFNKTFNVGPLVAGGKMQSDYDDLRVVNNSNIEYKFNYTVVNTTAINVFWKYPDIFPAGIDNVCFYYGNAAATSGTSAWRDVYLEYDNFDDNVRETTNIWTDAGTVAETGGLMYISSGGTWANTANTKRTFNQPVKITFDWQDSSPANYGTTKWSNDATGGMGYAGEYAGGISYTGTGNEQLATSINGVYEAGPVIQVGTTNWQKAVITANATAFTGSLDDNTAQVVADISSFSIETMFVAMSAYNSNIYWDNFTVSFLFNKDPAYSAFGEEQVAASDTIATTLIAPSDNSLVSGTTNPFINFTAWHSATGYILSNATYYIYNYDGTVYNSSITASFNATNGTTKQFLLPQGNYKWNVKACGINVTGVGCAFAGGNFSLNVTILPFVENAWTYNATTYEGSTEGFIVNVSYSPSLWISIQSSLVYNGTSYATAKSELGNNVIFSKSLSVPLAGTKNIYLNVTLTNSTGNYYYNSSVKTQTINPIIFAACNTTINNTYINFTIKDENLGVLRNGTFDATFTYSQLNKNYSYSNQTGMLSNFPFCVSPPHVTLLTSMVSTYTSSGYYDRTYYLSNAYLTNTTSEIDLLVLNTSFATKFYFTLTQQSSPVTNAYVTISKYNVATGNYMTVGIRKSDNVGKFIEYLELDKEYQFSVSKNGEFLGILYKTSSCSAAPCEVELELSAAITDLWSGYYNIYATDVAYSLAFNSTSKNITFIFTDLTGLAQYFRLQVNQISYNQTGLLICNITSYTAAGTITCGLSGYTGNFRGDAFISRSPEKFLETIFAIVNTIKEVIGKEGLFFTLIVVVVLGMVGAWNPVVGIILVVTALTMSFFMGFISISYTAIILVIMLAVFMIVKMGRGGQP